MGNQVSLDNGFKAIANPDFVIDVLYARRMRLEIVQKRIRDKRWRHEKVIFSKAREFA
jgi:hypothetical protein